MLFESSDVSRETFEQRSGWQLTPEGACQGGRCVPLQGIDVESPRVDVRVLADQLGMSRVEAAEHGLLALGPAAGGRMLTSAECPEITLPDLDGAEFSLSSLRGRKIVLVAWASW